MQKPAENMKSSAPGRELPQERDAGWRRTMEKLFGAMESSRLLFALWIVVAFLLSRLIIFFLTGRAIADFNLFAVIDKLSGWDAAWYAYYSDGIADGTLFQVLGPQSRWAFFPLLPLIIAGLRFLLGGTADLYVLASAFNSLLFMLAEYMGGLYIFETRKSMKEAWLYVLFMSFGLYSFYFSIYYTESLFLFLLTLCFYFMHRKNYIAMGISGALLTATRNVGILFVFVILADQIHKYRMKNRRKGRPFGFFPYVLKQERLVLGTCLVPMGFIAYMAVLEHALGDGLAFLHAERGWDHQYRGIGIVLKSALANVFPPAYLGVMSLIFICLIVIGLFKYRKTVEMSFPLLICLVAASSSLTSLPRYLIGAFTPVLIFCDEFAGLHKVNKAIIAVCVILFEVILIREWINGNSLLT